MKKPIPAPTPEEIKARERLILADRKLRAAYKRGPEGKETEMEFRARCKELEDMSYDRAREWFRACQETDLD